MSPALETPASKPRPKNRPRKLTKLRPGPAALTNPTASSSNNHSDASPRASSDPGRVLGQHRQQSHGPMPPSPDLSSEKWLEYTRKSGYLCPMESSPHLRHTRTRSLTPHTNSNVVSELAHLAMDVPEKSPRRSLERQQTAASPKPASSSLRRYAKTPVLRVGQLEADAATRPDAESVMDQSPEPRGSPASDGTLVAFEEDTIFFKPVSLWREPLPPIREGGGGDGVYDKPDSRDVGLGRPEGRPEGRLPQPGALGLQIATSLLSRELSCAVSNEALRAPTDVRQLQAWVMIEAYDALRDQVLQMGLPADEAEGLRAAFGMWLRALYRVHDTLAREASGPSDGDVHT